MQSHKPLRRAERRREQGVCRGLAAVQCRSIHALDAGGYRSGLWRYRHISFVHLQRDLCGDPAHSKSEFEGRRGRLLHDLLAPHFGRRCQVRGTHDARQPPRRGRYLRHGPDHHRPGRRRAGRADEERSLRPRHARRLLHRRRCLHHPPDVRHERAGGLARQRRAEHQGSSLGRHPPRHFLRTEVWLEGHWLGRRSRHDCLVPHHCCSGRLQPCEAARGGSAGCHRLQSGSLYQLLGDRRVPRHQRLEVARRRRAGSHGCRGALCGHGPFWCRADLCRVVRAGLSLSRAAVHGPGCSFDR
mmetsp:Transcript_18950/g.66131  ORF Transcript_18950/g.66131 Transcript_18950/m.66131 type:complete len:300 (+) Transcript_18950:372-1271(+)